MFVESGRRDCLYYKLTHEPKGSGELKRIIDGCLVQTENSVTLDNSSTSLGKPCDARPLPWQWNFQLGRAKRIWYLSPMGAAKVQASLRIRAVSPEPPLLAHTSSESRGPFRQKARSLAPLNGWACAVKICHDGTLEDTNSLDAAQFAFDNHSNVL